MFLAFLISHIFFSCHVSENTPKIENNMNVYTYYVTYFILFVVYYVYIILIFIL